MWTWTILYKVELSLQRVADEHPRRYLARALFDAFAVQALAPDSDLPVIGDAPMILMTPDEAGASEYARLYRAAANDKDGIAIRQFGDHYAAVSVRKEMVAILPQFGHVFQPMLYSLSASRCWPF